MIFTASDSTQIFYETHGDPRHPPLLLIHGLGADHAMWQPQIASYPQAGLFIIVPDVRGHGASAQTPTFTIPRCAQDLAGLLDALHIEKVSAVGVSMGGIIAQQLALDHPARVERMVVVDSFSSVRRPIERFNAWLASFLLIFLPVRAQAAMIRITYKNMGFNPVGEYLAERLTAANPRQVQRMRTEVNRFDVYDRLKEIRAPTLVLVGTRFGKLAVGMARATAEGIPGARFADLPGGGDPSNLLVTEPFDRAVLEFVK